MVAPKKIRDVLTCTFAIATRAPTWAFARARVERD